MKNSTRRVISMLLALCMSLAMLLAVAVPVEASPTVFSQLDSRWKDHQYGYSNSAGTKKATIGSGGCGILSLVNAVYYLSGKFIDPISLADWSVNKGYRINGVGTSHGLFTAYSNAYGSTYGFSCTSSTGTTSWDTLRDHLQSGGVSIASIKTVSTGSDHLLVIADYNSSDSTYLVLDSYASSNRGTSSGYAWMTKTQFLNRMNAKKFILISSNGHTHSYAGSYHDAAHPHKVYQKCSCGAINYTGATITVSSCATCNPVGTTSKYNTVLPFKAFLKGNADIVPYSDKQMTDPKGEIWATDECTITAVYSNGACEVKYLAGSETKTAYTQLSKFVDNTGASLTQQTVSSKIDTYIRASTGSTQYGHTDPGDVIYKLGTSGSMTQIFYPTGSGYKLAWVVTSELTEPTYDNRFNPYCPIKGYPCATATFDVYESDRTKYKGKIFTTDYCTINAVYSDGWCQVTYPTSSGDKTGYITLNKFVCNVNASHVKYTANAQIKVHKNSSLPGDMNWYISSGDQFFAVGSSGSSTQVLYPIDAQYGGGYKLGWISTANIPKTTYTVSYNANGGSGAPGNQTKTHGVALTLSSTKPTRSGHTFVGWGTSASATTAAYMPGASYTNDANLTLYAVWKLNKYEISYNANGGTGAPATQNKTHGQNLTLSSSVPTKHYSVTFNANGGSVDASTRQVACTFKGWATSSSATSAAYQPGGTFTTNANTTLYAIWQNPALGAYPVPARSGYVFDGWYTASSGGSQVTSSTAISGNITIYAHWIAASYGVDYDANGGTGAPESQVKIHGQNLTLSSVIPTRESYFFCGWGTEEDPASVQYQPGGIYTANSDIRLIAVWEKVSVERITVAANPSKTVYYKGETLDTTGLKLTAVYSDGTTKTITSGFSCSPMVLNTAGTQTITVSYGNKSTSFTVKVLEHPDGRLSVSKVSGVPGETVRVAINLDSNPGIITARLQIAYDSDVLTLVDVEDGGILGEHVFGGNLSANPYIMFWENGLAEDDYTATGTLAWLTFKITENAPVGEFPITVSYNPEEIYNIDLVNVAFSVSQGTVTVSEKLCDHNYQNGYCTVCGAEDPNYHYTPVTITKQPVSVNVANGKIAKVTVTASGDGLTYQWYYKNAGDTRFYLTTSFTGNTYSVTMDASRAGRQVYCVISDLYGNTVQTNTVTLNMVKPVTITKQPVSVTVANGKTATVSVTATGDGLTYKWYFKNPGDPGFYLTNSFKSNTYSVTMDASRSGRQVYCVITDMYGNSVGTDTVTLKMGNSLTITKQPVSVTVANGKTASVYVNVSGEGLTFKWYYKNAGDTQFYRTTSFTSNIYSVTMDASRNGRQVYCVISDKYGNTVQTNTVTLKMAKPLTITKQPVSVTVPNGKTASVYVNVSGEGLTFKWYYKNAGDTQFYRTTSFTSNIYSVTMDASRNGRQVYCVISDKYGNSIGTNTVTLKMATPLAITKQPANVTVAKGATASTTVTATGDGLRYTWYVMDVGAKTWTKSSVTSKTYAFAMTAAKSGRHVYCVITDAYGNKVTTKSVTMNMKSGVSITTQPVSTTVASGKTATVKVTASGTGLTYKWYYKNPGDANFYLTNSFKGNSYSVVMDSSRSGRQVYCVISDRNGNTVATSIVSLKMK